MTKILVTGLDGYVGSHVIRALKSRPIDIHVVTRNSEPTPPKDSNSRRIHSASKTLWSFFAPGFAISQNFDGKAARESYGWHFEPRKLAAELVDLAKHPGP